MRFEFSPPELPPETMALRRDVRAFLAEQREKGRFVPQINCWAKRDPAFSRECGAQGYIGMILPKRYGGGERTTLERYVVYEEMLAAGAPVGAHWVADRQSGPQIARHGTQSLREKILPRLAAGECYFAIGMSEPDTGSDLASVRTRADRAPGGWVINGSKLWTSGAELCHYLIALCRTSPKDEKHRHGGLTQFVIDLAAPGVTIRPIFNLADDHEFNELVFTDVFVPDEQLLGEVGGGWSLVMGELAFERSGPDRFLSTFQLLEELRADLEPNPSERERIELGRLVAHVMVLRQMSLSIAGMLQQGKSPALEASVVKDLGTEYEREVAEVTRRLVSASSGERLRSLLGQSILEAPSFTLRGGTREVLRGIIAKGIGVA